MTWWGHGTGPCLGGPLTLLPTHLLLLLVPLQAWAPDRRTAIIKFDPSNPNIINPLHLGDEVCVVVVCWGRFARAGYCLMARQASPPLLMSYLPATDLGHGQAARPLLG